MTRCSASDASCTADKFGACSGAGLCLRILFRDRLPFLSS